MQELQCKEEYQNYSIRFHRQLVRRNERKSHSKVIENFGSHSQVNTYCDKLGGYLAELDDWDELRFAQNVVLTSDRDIVYIAGSDRAQEGRWIFPRTGQPIRVFDWKTREPNNLGNVENCLHLWKSYDAKMNDYVCEFTKQKSYFLCEV
nr:perlucin-like protein [Biomphalaria glabrata]